MPIIPNPIPTPTARQAELRFHRRNTTVFIAWNPYDVILIPRIKVKSGSGSKITDGPPRPVQRMRLIPQTETSEPFTTDDGVERVISYVLLGEWDCVMEVGDQWRDSMGFKYEVLNVAATNGYEVKGLIEAHGNK